MGKQSKRNKQANRQRPAPRGRIVIVPNPKREENLLAMKDILLDFAAQFPKSTHTYYISSMYRSTNNNTSASTSLFPWYDKDDLWGENYNGYY